MTFLGTFCTSGMALLKAGENVNENFYSGCHLLRGMGTISGEAVDLYIEEAESIINDMARLDFTTNYAILSNDTKKILEEISSNLAAIYMVTYDMSGYTSRVEAEDIITVLRDAVLRGLSIIRDKKNQGFILRPTEGTA